MAQGLKTPALRDNFLDENLPLAHSATLGMERTIPKQLLQGALRLLGTQTLPMYLGRLSFVNGACMRHTESPASWEFPGATRRTLVGYWLRIGG